MAPAIPLVAIGLTLAATGFGVVSSLNQAQAQSNSERYNSEVASNNATASQQQAQYDATQEALKQKRIRGTAAAQAAKNGFQLDGTYDDVTFDSAIEGEKDLLAIKYRGDIQSNQQVAQSKLASAASSAATSQGLWAAGGTVLSGASRAYGQYSDAQVSKPAATAKTTPTII